MSERRDIRHDASHIIQDLNERIRLMLASMRIRTFKIRPRARVRLFFGEKQMITMCTGVIPKE